MARNKLAGSKKGTSVSARYFQSHPKARKIKDAINKKLHATKKRKKYRVELNRETRKKRTPGKDVSHSKTGKITGRRKNSSANRADKKNKPSK